MGSWSVYCGISKIAITSGQDCVLLPLNKYKFSENGQQYHPLTLPIFGKYDDYGGIEHIIKDANTELIEKAFGLDIQDFCKYITDYRSNYNDHYSEWYGKEHLPELMRMSEGEGSKPSYMWIDRKVYDYMSKFSDAEVYFELGEPYILRKLGFKEVGVIGYELGDFTTNGAGSYIQHKPSNETIYRFSGLKKLGLDVSYFEGKSPTDLYELMTQEERLDKMVSIIGLDRHSSFKYDRDFAKYVVKSRNITDKEEIEKIKKESYDRRLESLKIQYPHIIVEYIRHITNDDICKLLSECTNIRDNMYSGSMSFEPMVVHRTPQCGAYLHHQKVLSKFAEINQSYIEEYDYDNYDEDED